MTDTPKTEAPKKEAKKPTDAERIDAIVKLLEANGLTIPKELK